MIARLIQNRQHIPLDLRQVRRQQPIHPPGRGGAFQGVAVHVVQGVPGDAAHADLAVLRRQIPLQIPVAQVAVFRVDLPHDSHLLDFTGHPLHRPEFGRHLPAAAQDLPAGESSIPRQILSQVLRPAAPECLRRAGDCLVWPGLVPQQGQRVRLRGLILIVFRAAAARQYQQARSQQQCPYSFHRFPLCGPRPRPQPRAVGAGGCCGCCVCSDYIRSLCKLQSLIAPGGGCSALLGAGIFRSPERPTFANSGKSGQKRAIGQQERRPLRGTGMCITGDAGYVYRAR